MYPILTRFGPFLIYSYEVILALGIAASVGLASWLMKEDKERRSRFFDACLFAALFAILGGRFGFVISHWSYYSEVPSDIWLVWRGGLSYHGVLLGGVLAFWLWTRWRKESFAEFAGVLALMITMLSVFGWLACLLEGSAYGEVASAGLLVGDLPDSFGVYSLRYGTQMMGLTLSGIVLTLSLLLYKHIQPLSLFWLTMSMLAASRLFVTLFRGDEAVQVGSVRVDTIADVIFLLVSIAAFIYTFFTERTLRTNEKTTQTIG
ncbi:MAG: prolipoprotein diacylglyceryl transferase [Candidatus Promineifilaceae bacterium]